MRKYASPVQLAVLRYLASGGKIARQEPDSNPRAWQPEFYKEGDYEAVQRHTVQSTLERGWTEMDGNQLVLTIGGALYLKHRRAR